MRGFGTKWLALLGMWAILVGVAPGALALTVADLDAGADFASGNGAFVFSDFDFTAIGFDESRFDDFLVNPYSIGFRLILGFTEPFETGSLQMTYTVTGSPGIGSGRIPFFGMLDPTGTDPFAQVELTTSNGVVLGGSTTDFTSWQPTEAFFDREGSLLVSQVVTLTGGRGTLKLDNDFNVSKVPEPGTGPMLALGIAAWIALRRRSRA